jgi:hypothetical protein
MREAGGTQAEAVRTRVRRAPGAAREWAWWTVNGQAGVRERWKRRRWYWGRRLEIASETASYWAWRMATARRRRREAKAIEWTATKRRRTPLRELLACVGMRRASPLRDRLASASGSRRRSLPRRFRAVGIASGAALVVVFSAAAAIGLFSTGSDGDRVAAAATLRADADGTVASAMTATQELFRVEEHSGKRHRRSRAAKRSHRKAAARKAQAATPAKAQRVASTTSAPSAPAAPRQPAPAPAPVHPAPAPVAPTPAPRPAPAPKPKPHGGVAFNVER